MNIYVISLKESIERRDVFNKLNNKYIEYEYFDAIKGSDEHLSDSLIIKEDAVKFSKAAIGCALSHLNLWKLCVKLNKPIVIMEDDAFVSSLFNSYLDTVIKMLPTNFDILQLCYNCDSILGFSNTNFETAYTFFSRKRFNDNDIDIFQKRKIYPTVARLHTSFGTGCYVITPKGASILIKNCFPLDNRELSLPLIGKLKSYTIDCLMNTIYKNINAYVCPIPFVMTKHLHEQYKSTIN